MPLTRGAPGKRHASTSQPIFAPMMRKALRAPIQVPPSPVHQQCGAMKFHMPLLALANTDPDLLANDHHSSHNDGGPNQSKQPS